MDVGIHQRKIVDLIDLDVMLKNWGYSPRIGTVTTETPTSLQIGFQLRRKI